MQDSDYKNEYPELFDIYHKSISSASEGNPVAVFDEIAEIKTVKYATQLLSKITSADQIKTLPRTEFEKQEVKKRGQDFYHFTNNTFIAALIKSKYVAAIKNHIPPTKDKLYEKQVIDFLQEKKSVDLIICNMGASGSGVFVNQEIPENTLITVYNGELSSMACYKKSFPNLKYAFYAETIEPLYTQVVVSNDGRIVPISLIESRPFVISAHQYGSYGTFFQHLPTQASLSKMGLSPEYSRYIATENIKMTSFSYNGFPLLMISASRKINPGEQVGFDYSSNSNVDYWHTQNTFTLFNRRGEEIVSVTDGKILPKDFKELAKKVLIKELDHCTSKVNPALVSLWKATSKNIYMTAEKSSLLPLVEQFKEMNIKIIFSKVKDSDNYCLVVNNLEYKKFLKLAENEDLTPKFQEVAKP